MRLRKKSKVTDEDLQTTDALSHGYTNGTEDIEYSRPSGQDGFVPEESEGPFADSHNEQHAKIVNKPSNDPECFDDLQELGWQRTIWEDIRVGDFIKVYDDEPIPAGEQVWVAFAVCYHLTRRRVLVHHGV